MGVKTYPDYPYAWTSSLTPSEGSWHSESPVVLSVVAWDENGVGFYCIESHMTSGDFYNDFSFTLHNGREFDGTRDSAELRFRLAEQEGKFKANVESGNILLYDVAGNSALHTFIPYADGQFRDHVFSLGSGHGWTESGPFDWRFIKTIRIAVTTETDLFGSHVAGDLWIYTIHFTYYELEPGILNVLSAPSGKNFRWDSQLGVTPRYNLGLLPNTDYEVGIDPTDFKQWEDGDPHPIRTVNLNEAEEKTITAYYEEAPPPPPPNGPDWRLIALALGLGALSIVGIVIYVRSK